MYFVRVTTKQTSLGHNIVHHNHGPFQNFTFHLYMQYIDEPRKILSNWMYTQAHADPHRLRMPNI